MLPEGLANALRPEDRQRVEAAQLDALDAALTLLQLACQWNLAHAPVRCVAPTLIEEPGSPKPIERKRDELTDHGTSRANDVA